MYSIVSVGAGSKTTLQVPSPLSVATGPSVPQPHQGPVIPTVVASAVTVSVSVGVGSGSGSVPPVSPPGHTFDVSILPRPSVPSPALTIWLPPDASSLHNIVKLVVAGIVPSAHVISAVATPSAIVVAEAAPPP